MSKLSQSILDTLPHQIAVVDTNGAIILVNSAWENFTVQNNGQVKDTGTAADHFDGASTPAELHNRPGEATRCFIVHLSVGFGYGEVLEWFSS